MPWVLRARSLRSAGYIENERYDVMNEELIPVFVGMDLGGVSTKGPINKKQVPGLHNRMFSGYSLQREREFYRGSDL